MGLISGIAGGTIGAAGGFLASSAADKGYEEALEMYNRRMSEIKSHRDKVYYQDPTQSAENQAAVTQAQKVLAEQGKRTRATNAVAGGTDESAALEKAQGAAAVGNMMTNAAVQGEAKKEQAYQDAENQINTFTKYIADTKMARAQSKAAGIQGAFGGLAKATEGLSLSDLGMKGLPV